jgi:hypothetical protein
MYTSLYSAIRIRTGAIPAPTGEQVLSPETREREKKIQIELELWQQQVKREAQLEAGRGTGSLVLGGVEAQLRRVSEQVTHEAQEKQKQARRQVQS